MLNQGEWFRLSPISDIKYTLGVIPYVALIIFFAYVYTSITFNTVEVANNLKNSDAIIPGVRQRKPTSDYFSKILKGKILKGAIWTIVIVIIPVIISGVLGASVSFGRTSLIIVVCVVMEVSRQIKSITVENNYRAIA